MAQETGLKEPPVHRGDSSTAAAFEKLRQSQTEEHRTSQLLLPRKHAEAAEKESASDCSPGERDGLADEAEKMQRVQVL